VIEVSPLVRNKALAAGAGRWLDDLPALVASLERDWGVVIGDPFADGTEAFVAAATLADGTPAVMKVMVPRDDTSAARHEITVLRLANGEGCAELLRSDESRGALLLERLGPSLHDLGLPLRRRLEILTSAASRVWRAAPDAGLPTGADKGRWLVDFITTTWAELDRPCPEGVVDHALACADRRIRAHDDERAVLVHGDVHEWNALQAGAEFKLVDPDGLLAAPEYDLGVLMREDPVELMAGDPRERARWLAHRTGLDVTAIWEWGVVERVSTGLVCTRIDLQPVGRDMLTAADRIATAWAQNPSLHHGA
jgi:streptomycin 6-kinase